MTKKVNHLHKYKKFNLGMNGKDYFVYKCMIVDCSHYVPVQLAEGKLCECNRCGDTMVITKVQLKGSVHRAMSRPHCLTCIKRRTSPDVEAISEFLAGTKV